ncbi:hypothetical protein SDC9_154811 [bioreactor metagenome]|uniref:Uncharacterized protein n=1 Tax=bioreactor metagenome TaxID=1076179 RepID=A0A645EZS5_9ZZZZ
MYGNFRQHLSKSEYLGRRIIRRDFMVYHSRDMEDPLAFNNRDIKTPKRIYVHLKRPQMTIGQMNRLRCIAGSMTQKTAAFSGRYGKFAIDG